MKLYAVVDLVHVARIRVAIRNARGLGYTPVCVENREASEPLDSFTHPQKALYVFGPEDGGVDGEARSLCHRFVRIPTDIRTPLNLAAAVNVVLYDRFVKRPEGTLARPTASTGAQTAPFPPPIR